MKNDDYVLGKRISAVLKEQGKTQTELCEEIGMGTSTLNALIMGERKNPRIETIVPIAKGLNVSLDYLLGITDEPTTDIDKKAIMEEYGISSKALESIKGSKELFYMLGYDSLAGKNIAFEKVINTFLESESFFSFTIDFLDYLSFYPSYLDTFKIHNDRSTVSEAFPMSILEDVYLKRISDDIERIKKSSDIYLNDLKKELTKLKKRAANSNDYEPVKRYSKQIEKLEEEIKQLEK